MTDNNENNKNQEPDDYKVGYGHPPKEYQYPKGVSGNPKGRPKRPKTIQEAVSQALFQKTSICIDGEKKTVTKLEVLGIQAVNDAIKKDKQSRNLLMRCYQDIYIPETAEEREEEEEEEKESTIQKYFSERNFSPVDKNKIHKEVIELIRSIINKQSRGCGDD